MARNRPRRHTLTTIVLVLACLAQVGAGTVVAAAGAPTFELGSELLVTDVAAARLVGYGTVGERALELQLSTVSANVRVLVVAPDGTVVPFLGSFAEGRLVLLLADGGVLDVADHLARDDRDLVFVLPDGRRVLVPVDGRDRTTQGDAPGAREREAPASTPVAGSPDDRDDADDHDDDDDDDDDDSDDDDDD
jgi:hypothetical protein